jgi:ferredoxin
VKFDTAKLAYYSPTGTTRKILNSIAEGLGVATVEDLDLTLPGSGIPEGKEAGDALVVFGVPVYEGRVARTAVPRIQQLQAEGAPAVIVVLYGNRDYEDALLELNDLTREMGFLPVAGGAFVGEHSFANEDRPIGNGRPDEEDLAAARAFGAAIHSKLEGLATVDAAATITPPGNTTYIERDRSALADRCATTIEETCTLCGDCAGLCPVGAITIGDVVETDNMACTLCNACVKGCPEGARVVDDPMINKIVAWVSKNFQARREPETFL